MKENIIKLSEQTCAVAEILSKTTYNNVTGFLV
jgi:hypothetical protein